MNNKSKLSKDEQSKIDLQIEQITKNDNYEFNEIHIIESKREQEEEKDDLMDVNK